MGEEEIDEVSTMKDSFWTDFLGFFVKIGLMGRPKTVGVGE